MAWDREIGRYILAHGRRAGPSPNGPDPTTLELLKICVSVGVGGPWPPTRRVRLPGRTAGKHLPIAAILNHALPVETCNF